MVLSNPQPSFFSLKLRKVVNLFFRGAFCLVFTGKHTIFGRICGGIDVVNRIGLIETDPGDR